MSNRDLISLAFRNLLRRKTRTILAIVGVVVGTSAIIVMLSIGFGLSASFQEQIESYGNLHLVDVYSAGGGGMMYSEGGGMMYGGGGGESTGVLNEKAIASMEKIKGVDAVSPKVQLYLSFGVGKYIAQASVIGMKPEVMQKFGYELQDGRLLEAGDKFAMVFGNQVPSWFYNPKKTWGSTWGGEAQVDVITNKMIVTADESYGQKQQQRRQSTDEEKIIYKEYKAKGVGILANPNDESAYNVYMSLEGVEIIKKEAEKARKENVTNNSAYESAMVYVGDIGDVEDVSNAIRDMGFQTSSLNDWLKSMQETARMIQGILGGIGAISLLVAALGITNTMIMSIYERTKEIGIMKVIGANLGDIKNLFLLEAGMIGFLGGTIGLIFSYILSLLMNTVLSGIMTVMLGSVGGGGSTVSIIPWWVAAGSLAFSTTIGILAGYSPARRAMRLSALESLRNE